MTDIIVDTARPGWGEPIASWTYSTGLTTIPFLNLGGFRELRLWGYGITFAASASDAPICRLSDDGGATYEATGYLTGDSTSTGITLSTNVATEHAFELEFYDFGHPTRPTNWRGSGSRVGVANNHRQGYRAAAAYNALAIIAGGGNNFAAGTIYVYGRN